MAGCGGAGDVGGGATAAGVGWPAGEAGVSAFPNDVTGRVTHEWTPDGTAFTSPTGSVGPAIPYDRRYTYDNARRLTQVNDRTAAQTGIDITATPPSCVTRVYGFDANGNRTGVPDADLSDAALGRLLTDRAPSRIRRHLTTIQTIGHFGLSDSSRRTSRQPPF